MEENVLKNITENGIESLGRFYSIYRAIVVQNDDPRCINRLKVSIPGIQGGLTLWALPRNQHGNAGSGFKYLAPKIGDVVYVTFEFGDPTKPLWEYHSWSEGQTPFGLKDKDVIGFITPNGIQVIFDDSDGILDLYLPGEANIYSKGTIYVNGEGGVVVNSGENKGVVNIVQLTEKLNQLVSEVEQLKTYISTHTHSGVQTGAGVTTTPTSLFTKSFTKFNQSDYEDTKFTH